MRNSPATMNQPQTSMTDAVGLFVFLGTVFFSEEAAQVVGPYIAVFAASFVGGGFALRRRERTSRASAILFFARVCGASILVTGAIATMLVGMHPSISERAMLIPIAFVIGVIGDDWDTVLSALWSKFDLVYSSLRKKDRE